MPYSVLKKKFTIEHAQALSDTDQVHKYNALLV